MHFAILDYLWYVGFAISEIGSVIVMVRFFYQNYMKLDLIEVNNETATAF